MMYRQGAPPPPTAEKRCLYCGVSNDWRAAICECGAMLPPGDREEPEPPLSCPRCLKTELTFAPVYTRLAAAGTLLTLRRLFPWR